MLCKNKANRRRKMPEFKSRRIYLLISLILILSFIPLIGSGCAENTSSGIISDTLKATMVPNVNLDAYLYFDQGSPTSIPQNLLQSNTDIQINSLALWGICDSESYGLAAALIFNTAADAGQIYSLASQQKDVWTKQSDRSVYMLYGSGSPADSLKTAIENNNFKNYDDQKALKEVASLPLDTRSRPLAIGIVQTKQDMIVLLKKYVDASTAAALENVYKWGKPQTIILSLYSDQTLEIQDLGGRVMNNTIWDMNLGIVASVDSAFPGFLVSPIAAGILGDQGFSKKSVNNLDVYEKQIEVVKGQNVPLLVNVSGNHIYAASSLNAAYANTLMTGINR
jgi:hypothetical protein